MSTNPQIIAHQLSLPVKSVENTIRLLETGATIPFISRYRKEQTGSLDEVQVENIKIELHRLIETNKRREYILHSINEQGKLTEELKSKIENTFSLTGLEDIYLPYKPRRKTRAAAAIEKGLEPLAKMIMKQFENDPLSKAGTFLNDSVLSPEEALKGARDIIAEWITENEMARNTIRTVFSKEAQVQARVIIGKEEEGIKYKDYFNSNESLRKIPSHRLLAIRRAEEEGILHFSISPPEDQAIEALGRLFIKGNNESANQVKLSVKDAYKRLLGPSIETEFRMSSKEKADMEAIRVFTENLRQLLLSPPLGKKRVMAIDPGYRSGCKLVCLDEQGKLLHNETIFPHKPQDQSGPAMAKINTLVQQYKIDAIAVGDGTAGRETEFLIKKIRFNKDVQVFIVNEDGASVYSASEAARDEFPSYDVTVRGAVSIGRRLMDPLAELVKVDPKAIGVGQYQHDVDQRLLKENLDRVVESCVNKVGVDLNRAGKHLLTYVSGLGPQLAQNLVEYRDQNGPFKSREDLKKVDRMGEKAYEQCAGFLRIPEAENPLDNSAVHPETYNIVTKMASDLSCAPFDLIRDPELRKKIDLQKYISEKTGMPTLTDILNELSKPGRDPRNTAKVFEFSHEVRSMEDLRVGMILPGIVSNITNFGAFVDIGVKQDGLVHISNIADKFISNPADVLKLNQHVQVKVIDVDIPRKRIQLSMKSNE
jgi:uncharacterized protein